jgi:hypothetical protein
MEKIENYSDLKKKVLEIMSHSNYVVGELRVSFSCPKQQVSIKIVTTRRQGNETIISERDLA